MHYIGTVAVDLPPTTKNLSILTIIASSHLLILYTLSVDLAVTFTLATLKNMYWIELNWTSIGKVVHVHDQLFLYVFMYMFRKQLWKHFYCIFMHLARFHCLPKWPRFYIYFLFFKLLYLWNGCIDLQLPLNRVYVEANSCRTQRRNKPTASASHSCCVLLTSQRFVLHNVCEI